MNARLMSIAIRWMNVPPFIWAAVPRRNNVVRLCTLRPALPSVALPGFNHRGSTVAIFSLQPSVDVVRYWLTMIDLAYLIRELPPLRAWDTAPRVSFDVTDDGTIVT
jgi:hypothetical protein